MGLASVCGLGQLAHLLLSHCAACSAEGLAGLSRLARLQRLDLRWPPSERWNRAVKKWSKSGQMVVKRWSRSSGAWLASPVDLRWQNEWPYGAVETWSKSGQMMVKFERGPVGLSRLGRLNLASSTSGRIARSSCGRIVVKI